MQCMGGNDMGKNGEMLASWKPKGDRECGAPGTELESVGLLAQK